MLAANGEKHYVKGGKPGYYPPFKGYFNKEFWPHPLPLDLFDPFGLTKKMTPERKEKALLAEINNGKAPPACADSHRPTRSFVPSVSDPPCRSPRADRVLPPP